MNFERGKNPKKTMNIGKTVFNYLKGIMQYLKKKTDSGDQDG
jgi:hypothetical protein